MDPLPVKDPPATPPSSSVKLVLENVSKTYENQNQPIKALQPVTLQIYESEFIVFVGPSGCGKTTLLHLIAGFDAPTEGRILLEGKPVTRPDIERLMLFQEHALFPWLNVLDNVSYGLRRKYRFNFKARKQAAREFIRMVHLDEFEKASIHELSGGMKQRVALARALAPDPKLLLIDEPFPALDAVTRQRLYGDLQEIFTRTHKTIISVTHDTREAACLGDRVLVFSGRPGRIRKEIRIDLPRPRDLNDPKVAEYAAQIMAELEEGASDEKRPVKNTPDTSH